MFTVVIWVQSKGSRPIGHNGVMESPTGGHHHIRVGCSTKEQCM